MVLSAGDGGDAYDVLLVDIVMHQMNGDEVRVRAASALCAPARRSLPLRRPRTPCAAPASLPAQMLRRLRAIHDNHVPAVACTANALYSDIEDYIAAGFARVSGGASLLSTRLALTVVACRACACLQVLLKPFNVAQVADALEFACGMRTSAEHSSRSSGTEEGESDSSRGTSGRDAVGASES